MPVTVFLKATEERHRGTFATICDGQVTLYSEIALDAGGRAHGSGERRVFQGDQVYILAHDWAREVREEPASTPLPGGREKGPAPAVPPPSAGEGTTAKSQAANR